jgi:hypothetical protein
VHAQKTLDWLLKLKPEADDAMQIAALGHDIERAITKITNKDLKDMSNYEKDREEHSLRSVKYLLEILEKYRFNKDFISKVSDLVSKHEIGGDSDSDLLKDADSVAYFDYNIPLYLERNGSEKTKFKIKYMYDRISNPLAKDFVLKLKYTDVNIGKLVRENLAND